MDQQRQSNARSRSAIVGLGVAAAVVWGASRMAWLDADIFDDKSGDARHTIVGAVWSTEQSAIALLLLAAVVAALALRRFGRRAIGAIAAAGAIVASWSPMKLLTNGAEPDRVKSLLASGAASQRSSNPVTVAQWAEITNIDVHTLPLIVALAGCALALLAGLVLLLRPGTDGTRKNRYETRKTREEKIETDLEETPNSPRVLWDAIDADIDPTTRAEQ